MGLFSKSEYKYQDMSFYVDDGTVTESDEERCLIDIEATDYVDGKRMYFYSSFCLKKSDMYNNGDFTDLLNMLRQSDGKKVRVELKYKKDKLKDFKLLVENLAEIYNDERFLQLELTGWGMFEKNCRERVMQ